MSDHPDLRARLVLEDAREAADRLKRDLEVGGNWRINWVATVTLLRAVGHVLRTVDKQEEPAKTAILAAEARWKPKPARDAIYWDFIKPERDSAVHEYALGVYAPAYWLSEEGDRILLEEGTGYWLLEEPNVDRIDEALAWWEGELATIEAATR